MGVTEEFARFIVSTRFDELPSAAIERVKLAAFDCLGVTLSAVKDPLGQIMIKYVKESGGFPEAGVLGGGFKTSAEMAALANGTMAHALDYDDTGLSVGHPSICVVPTGLSLGDKLRSSGKALIEALAVGYETEGKIGYGSVYSHAEKGIHSSALFGTMGAAAVAAKLLKLSVDQARVAFGLAASQVGGLVKNAGTMTKPLHAGNACRAGIMSALLSRKGFTADPDIIEIPQGYGDTFLGRANYDEQKMIDTLGNPFHIVSPGLTVKKYPCCMLVHRTLDAIFDLIKENGFTHDQVASVTVGVPKDIFPLRVDAHTGPEGRFSIPYNVSAALVDGKVTIDTFSDEMVQRPLIRSMMSIVELQTREDIAIYTGSTSSGKAGNPVTVRLKDGSVYENQVNVLRGSPERPLKLEEFFDKYHDCVGGVLSSEQEKRSVDLALHLERLNDIGELMSLVTAGNFAGS